MSGHDNLNLELPSEYQPWATLAVQRQQVAEWNAAHQPADYYHYRDDPAFHRLLLSHWVLSEFESAYLADESADPLPLLDSVMVRVSAEGVYSDHLLDVVLDTAQMVRRWAAES